MLEKMLADMEKVGGPFKTLLYHIVGLFMLLFAVVPVALFVYPVLWPFATFIWYKEERPWTQSE